MKDCRIAVPASGVITLGPDVTCDGFHRDCGVRVQTHVHLDHMHNFETSKGLQDIYLSDQTLQWLIAGPCIGGFKTSQRLPAVQSWPAPDYWQRSRCTGLSGIPSALFA